MGTGTKGTSEPKKHEIDDMVAHYTRNGRKWCLEKSGKMSLFDTIEDLVFEFPKLRELSSIRLTLQRRASQREEYKAAPRKLPTEDNIIVKFEECYYCGGSGTAGFMPCDNCGGKGTVKLTGRKR